MDEKYNISRYNPDIVKTSKDALLESFTILKEFNDYLVLVGGWVPFLLLEKHKKPEIDFHHIGSVDIDIAIDHQNIPGLAEVYESIRVKLEKTGYITRKSKDGQDIPFSFKKTFQNIPIHIDFLASESEKNNKKHRHQKAQDILARKSKGVDLAFKNKELFSLSGILPNGAEHTIEINISGPAAMIAMKAFAFDSDSISRSKDVYDIYSILKYYNDGIESIIKEVSPFSGESVFQESLQILEEFFSSIEKIGPFALADFILPENKGSEDWEYYRRDVFEIIQNFITKISSGY
jgi:hypothetical protein